MAGAKKPNAGKQQPKVDRFENDWDGVPNFKLKPAAKKPAKKAAGKNK